MSNDLTAETQETTSEEVAISTEHTPASFSIDNASMEELNALADILSNADATTPQPEAQQQVVIEEEQTVENTELAEEEPLSVSEEENQPQKVSDRVRLSSLSDDDKQLVTTAVQLVKSGYARNITDALAQLTQDEPEETQAEAQQTAPPTQEADLSARITDIKARLKSAKEEFNTEAEIEILEELADAKAEIRFQKKEQAEKEVKDQEQKSIAFQEQYQASIAKANAAFPDGAKEGTPFFEEVRKTVAEFSKTKPWMLEDPEYPNLIAGFVAMKLGVTPANAATKTATQTSQARVAQTPRVQARTASPMVGGNATTAINRASIDSMISELTADEIDAVMRSAFA